MGPGSAGSRVGEQAALTQDRHDALGDVVGLLEVRIAGEDELDEAVPVIVGDAVGDLRMAADEGRARSPRTRPTPAHRLGAAISSWSVRPPCRATIRC